MQRRTQAERRTATRQALIDAAGELLVEQGWAQVTSVAVCARAGVTRGAFVHHFDGLPELFAAVLADRYDEIAATVEAGGEPTSIVEMVERAWAINRGPGFKVVLEAWLAGANDPDLGRMLDPVIATFAKLFGPDRWHELLPDDEARAFFLVARESLLGLAWGRAVSKGRPLAHETLVLDHLTATAKAHDARLGHGGGTP
ncbi:MAG: TetR/AcrR family transcriptional regulator [Actinomycetota bacterium]